MTSTEIKSLIKFLKNNGGPVISGHTKFSVTPPILKEINQILHTIKEDIFASALPTTCLVNKYANSNNDLIFLYEFVKKTPNLKISNTFSSHDFSVDVSDFTNLKYLELYKFNVKNVKGTRFLQENLEIVVCSRCLDEIGDLLLNCETDSNASIFWSKLRHAILSRNNLVSLDQSFIHTPWLQYLDISYNHLTDLRQLTCLSNLTHLNASYNNLTVIPKFSLCKLKILLISNNFITDIKGIAKLVNLQDFDLSSNYITEHSDLLPLADLPCLLSLNVSKNPISYHAMHRSLTCGYLHENVANGYFILDGHPLTSSERQFIRYCLRESNTANIYENTYSDNSSDAINQKKPNLVVKKKTRDAKIAENPQKCDENESVSGSTLIIKEDNDEHLEMKKQLEAIRKQYGGDHWLHSKAASEVQNLLGIENVANLSPIQSYAPPISESFNSKSEASVTQKIIDDSTKYEESLRDTDTEDKNDESEENDTDIEVSIARQKSSDNIFEHAVVDDEFVEEEEEQEEYEVYEGDSFWVVQKIISDDEKVDIFLVLDDTEIKEVDVIKTKVITRWSLDRVERCIKISNDPLIVKLSFNEVKRDDSIRKYIMEYADAQKLISSIERELQVRPLSSFNQTLLRCMKCNLLFCQEIRRRVSNFLENEKYACPTCNSTAVIEEDESVLPSKTTVDYSCSPNTTNTQNTSSNNFARVTQSPSLSSIGSAASLDRSSETINNNESHLSYQESDIEIISNPSQSSIEVLEVHGRSYDSSTTILQTTKTPTMLPSTAAGNQLLTESSSSGSMTDSVCTSYETNYYPSRTHRISQSTVVDEILQEESSVETSPKQRQAEEKITATEIGGGNANEKSRNDSTNKFDVTPISSYVSVLEDMLYTVSSKISLATAPAPKSSELDGSPAEYEYSYTNFTLIDHRIKLYIWDQIVPDNEEISAFIRINTVVKIGTTGRLFSGLLVLTNRKMYLIKITKEEKDENPANWLQNYDNICTDKIKLIQSILWKQGFCVNCEDRTTNGSNVKYIMLLYDENRTDNFLSFVKDLGSVHVQKSEDFSNERDLNSLVEVDETIRNFTMTDLITVYKDDVEVKSYNIVGLVITNSNFFVVKGEPDWLIPDSANKPSTIFKELMSNLVNVNETKNSIILQFLNEAERAQYSWDIKTVSSDAVRLIIEAIREPWEELFGVQL